MDAFTPATRAWLSAAFDAPTPAQEAAWDAIARGRDALVVAPTGSGKTLAAFLWALDRLAASPIPDTRLRLRVLYVSPLKALAVDVERNLRVPLQGIREAAHALGMALPDVTVAVRTGDTPAAERRRFPAKPPDILITTPESLFLILTSKAREALRSVQVVIVDEVHALVATKRGAHLALSLERVDLLAGRPQRVGLSATVRPPEEAARFLGGERAVAIVQPPSHKQFDLRVEAPDADGEGGLGARTAATDRAPGQGRDPSRPDALAPARPEPARTAWPAIESRLLELIRAHRSTIVFANSRRLAERIAARLNEMAEAEVARAHHGSISRDERRAIEEALKAGRLPAVVATSSLELGIDMGAVDLVIQVEAPPSVASGLQRLGRAGHQVGAVSRGVLIPKWRGDLLECAVVVERMRAGGIEALTMPRNPLDVLAQQIVSMVAMDPWPVDDLATTVRRAASFANLPQSALVGVLDMLSGLYPSDAFAELRPRLNWDRVTGALTPRPGARHLAVTSGGTIPDRGLFGVFTAGDRGVRVGELDEEMVYESRIGDVFALGASTWRITEITPDRVRVEPAPGEPAKLPFWHGDAPGRSVELGKAHGAFLRELTEGMDPSPSAHEPAADRPVEAGAADPPRSPAERRLYRDGLDASATHALLRYLREQRDAAGALPDDRTIVVERFPDEVGDWRLCLHSPFGARIHAPWALAIAARVRVRLGVDVQAWHTDDGIVIRLPESDESLPVEWILFDPDEIERIVTEQVGASSLFASRFRECAARALLLPRRMPGRRTPLWQQRQKSANLLAVAAGFGSFPIVLETMRECLQDVFDLPALRGLMADLRARTVRLAQVQTNCASPFATSLLFGYLGAFIYDGDAPLAERRAQALTLDTALLAELLGPSELREIIDADALAELERILQRRTPERAPRSADDVHDLLRWLGDLSEREVADRVAGDAGECAAAERVDGDADRAAGDAGECAAAERVDGDAERAAGERVDAADESAARAAARAWLLALAGTHRAFRVRVAGDERWIAIEDAARYREALGIAIPEGVPAAFLVSSTEDSLAALVARYARSHGPFHAADPAARLGVDAAAVASALRALERRGKVAHGEFRPGGHGLEWCDVDVLRGARRRSLAKLRREVEAVPQAVLGRFLPVWHGIGGGRARGPDAVLRAVEQLQGVPVPASALEKLVLPIRVAGYAPRMLDELCAAGEVAWRGCGRISADDGWLALFLTEDLDRLPLPAAPPAPLSELAVAVLDALDRGGAQFFRQIAERVGCPSDQRLLEALWDLAWAGRVANDTLSPLRALLGAGVAPTARLARRRPRRGPQVPSRQGPPAGVGRWSRVAMRTPVARETADATGPRAAATRTRAALAEQLLDRHGILTRGAVMSEGTEGGFAAVYPVLKAFEEAGRCRRGYFVEGLGAAQFAMPGAVDRLRALAGLADTGAALVLAAADPANPYGAALRWPDPTGREGHRPGRKPGALVALVDGVLALYVERGGKTGLSFTEDEPRLRAAAQALAAAVRDGGLDRLEVERADGVSVFATPLARALEAAGFRETHRGLVLRP